MDSNDTLTESQARSFLNYLSNDKSSKKFIIPDPYIKLFSANTAMFLHYLVTKYCYYEATGQLVDNKILGHGFFFFTIEDAQAYLHQSRDEQDICIKNLKKHGLIEVVTMGTPPRRHFRISMINIANMLLAIEGDDFIDLYKSHKSRLPENSKLDLRKSHKLNEKETSFWGKATNAIVDSPQIASLYKINTTDIKDNSNELSLAPGGTPSLTKKTLECSDSQSLESDKCSKQHNIYSPTLGNVPAKPGVPPAPKKPKTTTAPETKIVRAHNVKTSPLEHDKLLANYCNGDAALLQEAYELLSEWKESASEAQVKKHQSDYLRMRRWVIRETKEERQGQGKGSTKIAKHRQGSKLVTPGDYDEDTFTRRRI